MGDSRAAPGGADRPIRRAAPTTQARCGRARHLRRRPGSGGQRRQPRPQRDQAGGRTSAFDCGTCRPADSRPSRKTGPGHDRRRHPAPRGAASAAPRPPPSPPVTSRPGRASTARATSSSASGCRCCESWPASSATCRRTRPSPCSARRPTRHGCSPCSSWSAPPPRATRPRSGGSTTSTWRTPGS